MTNLGSRLQCSLAATLALVLSAGPALAHPGHDLGEAGFAHVFTSPYHLAVLATIGGALWLAGYFVQRRVPRRVLKTTGAFAFAAAAVLWTV